ncbi:MAG TPA: prepilin peptidase [Hyphomicrobium sp.]|uniref:A24 family peptidase n=1 Tax=Hyphomicrobium sp. TaxID=82 RepID=UPI002C01BD8B|nr:prepilin peptidase [Hyphomicrobium sp.]HXE01098.1 prepilin peptidase [Hyphomicrobium sp.]
MLAYLILMTFPVAMAFAAANDLFTMKIPNRISLALIGGFVAIAVMTRMPLESIGIHVAIALGVLAATFVLFWMNMLGGGDAKLMAAGALWMGPDHIIEFLAYVTAFGGVLAVAMLAYRSFLPANAFPLPGWARRLHKTGEGIPYGIAIAAGGLLLFPETAFFRALAF